MRLFPFAYIFADISIVSFHINNRQYEMIAVAYIYIYVARLCLYRILFYNSTNERAFMKLNTK